MRYPSIHEIICEKGNPITYSIAELPRFDFTDPENPMPGALMLYLTGMRNLHLNLANDYPAYATQANAVAERLTAAIETINQLPITDGP